jgi:hypothetical protein
VGTGAGAGAGAFVGTCEGAGAGAAAGAGTAPTQRTRKALAQARAMYLPTAPPPFSALVPAAGTSVQQLCFSIVLDTHKKRREKP